MGMRLACENDQAERAWQPALHRESEKSAPGSKVEAARGSGMMAAAFNEAKHTPQGSGLGTFSAYISAYIQHLTFKVHYINK